MSFIEIKDEKHRYFINTSTIEYIMDNEDDDFIEIYFIDGKYKTISKPTINIYDEIRKKIQNENKDTLHTDPSHFAIISN